MSRGYLACVFCSGVVIVRNWGSICSRTVLSAVRSYTEREKTESHGLDLKGNSRQR